MWRVSSILVLQGLSTPFKDFGQAVLDRGSAVHSAAEAMAEGYTPTVDPAHAGYVDGLIKWFEKEQPVVVSTERRIVNRVMQLTGRMDLFALVNHKPTVVDVKTGGASPWHGLQTAGYRDLVVEDDALWTQCGPPFDKWTVMQRYEQTERAILYLPGDGTPKYRPERDPGDNYLFRAALALVRHRYALGLLHVTDPESPDDDIRAVQTATVAF